MSARRGGVAVGSALVAVGVWVACSGGLKVEEGNAFPCKFQAAEDVRDTQCPSNWRCGIDSQCHEAKPEEGPVAAEPSFSPVRRFPKLLTGEARYVASEENGPLALVKYKDGGVVSVSPISAQAAPALSVLGSMAWVGDYLVMMDEPGPTPSRVTLFHVNRAGMTLDPPRLIKDPNGQNLTGAQGLRASTQGSPGNSRDMLVVLKGPDGAGEVELGTGVYTPFPKAFSSFDGGIAPCSPLPCGDVSGSYLEVRPVPSSFLTLRPPPQRDEPAEEAPDLVPVAATPLYFLWRSQKADAGPPGERWQLLNPSDPIAVTDSSGNVEGADRWLLRHSDNLGVWALRRVIRGRDVLSTWGLSRSPLRPLEPRLERLWDDCSPCGTDWLTAFAPVSDGALGVEVLCESEKGARNLFRVVGASVVSPEDTCQRQALEAPLELSEVVSSTMARASGGPPPPPGPQPKEAVGDPSHGNRLALGGKHGQIWRGSSLSELRPIFLDRAPLSIEVLPPMRPQPSALIAFTPDYFAVQPPAPPQEDSTGLSVLTPRRENGDGGVPIAPKQEVLGGVVEGTPGWFLLEKGQLARVARADTGDLSLSSSYGPRLLNPSGETAQGPFLGAGAFKDGGVSLVLAAEDQLYYKELSATDLATEPELADTLSPRLTPESNFPVRSLARDRTLNLDAKEAGVQRVRGWAATSRSAYEFWQEADTLAWKLKALELGGGEPVEVWSREAGSNSYGRLGLRDGQVLRLPQGVPLTQPLPQVDRVVDYASLDGFPIALGEKAVYRTVPSAQGETGLPQWQALPLPAELASQGLSGARIFVVKENNTSILYLFTRTGFVYQLGTGKSAG